MSVGLLVLLHHIASSTPTPPPTPPPAPFVVPSISGKMQRDLDPGGWLESVWVCVGFSVTTLVVAFFGLARPLFGGAWRGTNSPRHRWRILTAGLLSLVLLATSVAAGINTSVGYVRGLHDLKNHLFPDKVAALANGARPATTPDPHAKTPPTLAAKPGAHSTPTPAVGVTPATVPVTPLVAAADPLPASEIVQIPLHAPEYGLPDAPAYVYLPKGYASTGPEWPLLLLIPAAPGSTDDWLHPGNVDKAMDNLVSRKIVKPYVIVIPTVNPSFLVDHECLDAIQGGPRVETYLIDVVMPALQDQLNISRDAHQHAIGGFSAGADCALNVGLHHLDVFSAIGAMDPEGGPGTKASHRYLGDSPDLIAQNSPRDYVRSMTFGHPLVVYLNGAGTLGVEHTDLLQHELEARGVYVYRHDEKGLGHNWRDARFDEPWMLSFFSAAFNAPPPPVATGAPIPEPGATPTPSG